LPPNKDDTLEVTDDTRPLPLAAASSEGTARRVHIPKYQRSMPMISTAADVKNISGNRSMSG